VAWWIGGESGSGVVEGVSKLLTAALGPEEAPLNGVEHSIGGPCEPLGHNLSATAPVRPDLMNRFNARVQNSIAL
jgi:hypothetical protein